MTTAGAVATCLSVCGQGWHSPHCPTQPPPAIITTAEGHDADGKPYVSYYNAAWWERAARDGLDRDHAALGGRVEDALRTENRNDRDMSYRSSLYVRALARAATGYRVGPVRYGTYHYYPDCSMLIVVEGAAGRALRAAKDAAWVEIPGVAHGYVKLPDSEVLSAIADLSFMGEQRFPSRLVHVVDDAGNIIHIGSMSRLHNGKGWDLSG